MKLLSKHWLYLMNKKTVGAVLLAVAATLGGPPAVEKAIDVATPVTVNVAIDGPTEVEVGELCHLTLTGTNPSWRLPTENFYAVDLNTVVVSFREPGEFVIIAAAYTGEYTAIVSHVVTVHGTEPAPEPEPDPEREVTEHTLSDVVYDWCVASDAPTAAIEKIGTNFLAAAKQPSIETILSFVASNNRKVKQDGCEQVLAQIQQHLFDNLSGQGVAAHQEAFTLIGEGLLKYTR